MSNRIIIYGFYCMQRKYMYLAPTLRPPINLVFTIWMLEQMTSQDAPVLITLLTFVLIMGTPKGIVCYGQLKKGNVKQ